MGNKYDVITALILCLIISSPATIIGTSTPSAATLASPSLGTVEGASLSLPEQQEQRYLDVMQNLTKRYSVSPRSNAFAILKKDTHWIVFTDSTPESGYANAQGTVISPQETGGSYGFVFANEVSYDTNGEKTSLSDIKNNPDKYTYSFVRVTAKFNQLSYSLDAANGDFVQQHTFGTLSNSKITTGVLPIGTTARWTTLNLSSAKYGAHRQDEIASRLPTSNDHLPTTGWETDYWINATTKVDAIVLPNQDGDAAPQSKVGQPTLFVVDSNVQGQQISSITEISKRGSELQGSVVTVNTQVVGSKTSSKRFLLKVAKCAPDSVTVPVTPPGCTPVVTDTIVHSGIAFQGVPQSQSDIVPFVGLSNHKQDSVTKPLKGSYQVTGRVVSTDKIDPSLPDGYALVVYEMDRTGGLNTSPSELVTKQQSQLQQVITAQINSSTYASSSENNTEETQSASDQGGSQSTTQSSSADISLVGTRLGADEIEPGQSTVVVATVKNTGGSTGSVTLQFQADGETVKSKSVRVKPGQSKKVNFVYSSNQHEKATLAVNGMTAGTVTVGNPSLFNTLLRKLPIQAFGLVLLVFGVLLILASGCWDILRVLKAKYSDMEPNTSEGDVNKLGGIGAIVSLPGALLIGVPIEIVGGFVALCAGAWVLTAGGKWLFKKV